MSNLSTPVGILAVGQGGHLTTRAHNRHLIYHSASETWYAFVGTGKALVKEAAGLVDDEVGEVLALVEDLLGAAIEVVEALAM